MTCSDRCGKKGRAVRRADLGLQPEGECWAGPVGQVGAGAGARKGGPAGWMWWAPCWGDLSLQRACSSKFPGVCVYLVGVCVYLVHMCAYLVCVCGVTVYTWGVCIVGVCTWCVCGVTVYLVCACVTVYTWCVLGTHVCVLGMCVRCDCILGVCVYFVRVWEYLVPM